MDFLCDAPRPLQGTMPELTERVSLRYSDIARKEGLRALFKGLGPTLVGVIPAR